MKKVFGNLSLKGGSQEQGMSSFQALATAIAAQVGTGNVIGASGAILTGGPGAILAQTAFGTVFGESLGASFVAIYLFFFAFSTILGWNMFGKINVIYLFGEKNAKISTRIYTVIALAFIFLGTLMSNDLVWELTDAFNYLMVIPNAIALFALTGMVKTSLSEVEKKKK